MVTNYVIYIKTSTFALTDNALYQSLSFMSYVQSIYEYTKIIHHKQATGEIQCAPGNHDPHHFHEYLNTKETNAKQTNLNVVFSNIY